MQSTDVECVFLGDAPGQGEACCIGGVTYERGKKYTNVPPQHYSKGGFYTISEDGVVVVRGRPVRRCIVLGTAPCMWEDLAEAQEILGARPYDVIAVNGAGWMYPGKLKYWLSIHGNKLVSWLEKRRERGYDMDFIAGGNFSPEQAAGAVERLNVPNGGGSSGLYAVLQAINYGYDQVICCGVPLTGRRRFDYEDDRQVIIAPSPYEDYHTGWHRHLQVLRPRVRSMSGWTRELLGRANRAWLEAGDDGRLQYASFITDAVEDS